MGTQIGYLNQSITANLDAASNEYIYIEVNNPVPTYIYHVNYGVALVTAALRTGFGWMSFQVLRNVPFDPGLNLGNFSPAPGKNCAFFDLLTEAKGRDLDFTKPIEIAPNERALVIATPPTNLSGVGGLGSQTCFLTVLADFGELAGRTVHPRPFGG